MERFQGAMSHVTRTSREGLERSGKVPAMRSVHGEKRAAIPVLGIEYLPKIISEMVGQTCRFASIPRRESPPFRNLFLAANPAAFTDHLWVLGILWHDTDHAITLEVSDFDLC